MIKIKKARYILIPVLSLSILTLSSLPLYADSLSSAINQQQQLEQQKQDAQKILKNLQYTETTINSQLDELNSQITQAEGNLQQKNKQYNQLTTKLEQSKDNLAQKQKELAQRQQAFANRVKEMYVDGLDVSYLELLFNSTGIEDFLTRFEYFTRLVDNDKNLLAGIQTDKEEITQQVNNLTSLTQQAAELKAEAQQETEKLNQNQAKQKIMLSQIQDEANAKSNEIRQMDEESKALNQKIHELQAALGKNGNVIGNIKVWPLPGNYQITDPFGSRVNPITHVKETHKGIDIAASTGTPIHAAGDGVVLLAGYSAPWGAFGNLVIIDHGKGVISIYGHQSKIAAKAGQVVKAGDVIGYVGSTGWSTGPHLHFEIRINDESVNPLQYFN